MLYRNYEIDDILGDCFRATQIGPIQDSVVKIQEKYILNGSVIVNNKTLPIASSPCYTVKNKAKYSVDKGTGCFLMVNNLEAPVDVCCEFVYDLLCGPTKIPVHDPALCACLSDD
ncbi:uncharacterized protein LOC135370438 [Ornithodoros turicata]|uniref:uncharacterized protein LOC135370438 n=1 Tax=Ornithodoros turicata TaxID=34597 RepID=UPI003139CD57